jgi:hypothetical protein
MTVFDHPAENDIGVPQTFNVQVSDMIVMVYQFIKKIVQAVIADGIENGVLGRNAAQTKETFSGFSGKTEPSVGPRFF